MTTSENETFQSIDSISCKLIALEEDQVWLIKRTSDQSYGLPGGRLRAGETMVEALLREVEEETGATASPDMHLVDAFLSLYDPMRDNQDCMVLVYQGTLLTQPRATRSSEGEIAVKVHVSAIKDLPMRETYKQTIYSLIH